MIRHILKYMWYLIQLPIYWLLLCFVFTIPLVAMLWGFELHGPQRPDRI